MDPITRANIAKELWPGIRAVWDAAQRDVADEHTYLFDVESSDKAYEEMLSTYAFGLAPQKQPGTAVAFDTAGDAWSTRVENVAYALGFIVTREAIDDAQYGDLLPRYTNALRRSMKITKQVRAAAYMGLAFSSSQLGGDGVPLCSSSHPLVSGNTLSNLGSSADLSESALEAAWTGITLWTDERDMRIATTPRSLHIHPNENFKARRILNSDRRSGTADNDANVLKDENYFPGGIYVHKYFQTPGDWFIKTDAENGLVCFDRIPLDIEQGDGMDNQIMKVIAYERYSFVHANWRAIWGQQGA